MSKKLTKKQIQEKSVKTFGYQRFNFIKLIDKRNGKFYCNEHGIEFSQDIFSHFNGVLSCSKCDKRNRKKKRLDCLKNKTIEKYDTISLVRISKINPNKGFFFCSHKDHGHSKKSYFFGNTVLRKENFQIPCTKCQKENRKAPKNKLNDEYLKSKLLEKFKNLQYLRRNRIDSKKCFLECRLHGQIKKSILIDSLINKEVNYEYCDKCREKKVPHNKYSNKEIQKRLDENLNIKALYKTFFIERDINSHKESYGFFSCLKHGKIKTSKLISNSIRENAVNPCELCTRDLKSRTDIEIQKESDNRFGNFTFFGRTKEDFLLGYFVCKDHPERGVHRQEISSHIRGYNPCCKIQSKNEIEIMEFLNEIKTPFFRQYYYSECKNIKVLHFDFYLPEYNLLIEYDGEYHFEHIKGKVSHEKFLDLQKRDKIKNKFAFEKQINFLRIPYTHNNKKEELIKDVITKIDFGEYVYKVKLFNNLIKKSTQKN